MTHQTDAGERIVVAVWEPLTGFARTADPVSREPFTLATAHTYAAAMFGARVLAARNGAEFEPVPATVAARPRLAARVRAWPASPTGSSPGSGADPMAVKGGRSLWVAVDTVATLTPAALLGGLLFAAAGTQFWSSSMGAQLYCESWRVLHLLGLVS